jgi:co-chaperonin GroES (HSP10)
MSKYIIPMGDRIFVEELEPETSLQKRAEASGISIVVLDENIPRPTTGVVVAIGDDPLIQSRCKLGDIVSFSQHAGVYQQVEGKQYRCIEGREIISLIRETPPTPAALQDSPGLSGQPGDSPTRYTPTEPR